MSDQSPSEVRAALLADVLAIATELDLLDCPRLAGRLRDAAEALSESPASPDAMRLQRQQDNAGASMRNALKFLRDELHDALGSPRDIYDDEDLIWNVQAVLSHPLVPAQPEGLELKYRELLWLGHGHQGLYGDDGEMQCNMGCRLDYKRAPLEQVEEAAERAKMERVRRALSESPASPSEDERLIEQRVIGHGEGQEHTIADVNAGRVDDLIEPRLRQERMKSASPGTGGWQPIETAPKQHDGLLLSDGKTVTQGGWLSQLNQGADYEGQSCAPSAGWWSVSCDTEPSHWMPLPQPPSAVKEP